MTAQVSTNPAKPTNNFKTNYFIKVKSYLKLMVVLLVLHLVSAPMNLINLIVFSGKLEKYHKAQLVNPNSFGYPEFNYLYPIIGVLATGLAVLMGVIIALGVYNYFYKKPNVDMVYALPLTTNQRFFSDFLAGATVYLLPYVISCVISLIIHGIGCMVQNTYTEQVVSRLSGTNDNIPLTQTLIYVMIAGFIIMLMTYTLTVLVMTCCGSLFESVAYNILVNILIPGTIAVFFFFMIGDLYGVNYLQSITELIVRTSPVGAAIGLYWWAFGGGSYYGWDSVNSGFWSIFGTVLLITAGMLALAWYLNKKRKPEQVSKPFVFKIFYYIMITCVTFCIGSLFTMDNEKANIIPMIIVSAIVYFIFELITNRGFKKFHMSVIRYAVTITAVLGLIWVSDATEGFGAVRKIPDADSVKSVTVTGISPFMFDSKQGYTYTLTEDENIEAIVGVHQNVIDRYNPKVDKNTNVYVGMHHVYLTYNLKSGGKLSREYQLTTQEMLSLRNIERSEEYRKQLFKELSQKFNSYSWLTIGDFNFLSGEEFPTASDRAIADEFLAALEADLTSFSEEEYFEPSGEYLFPIYVGYGCEFPITENHKNVLAFCQKYHPNFKSLLDYKSHQVEFMSDLSCMLPNISAWTSREKLSMLRSEHGTQLRRCMALTSAHSIRILSQKSLNMHSLIISPMRNVI